MEKVEISDSQQEQSLATSDALSAIRRFVQTETAQNIDPISKDASQRIRSSLDRLENDRKLTFLEQTIVSSIAPMVREWLDKNLPDIVEKVVEKEIRSAIHNRDR
jgi:cell pole-organizing protein PopZ